MQANSHSAGSSSVTRITQRVEALSLCYCFVFTAISADIRGAGGAAHEGFRGLRSRPARRRKSRPPQGEACSNSKASGGGLHFPGHSGAAGFACARIRMIIARSRPLPISPRQPSVRFLFVGSEPGVRFLPSPPRLLATQLPWVRGPSARPAEDFRLQHQRHAWHTTTKGAAHGHALASRSWRPRAAARIRCRAAYPCRASLARVQFWPPQNNPPKTQPSTRSTSALLSEMFEA